MTAAENYDILIQLPQVLSGKTLSGSPRTNRLAAFAILVIISAAIYSSLNFRSSGSSELWKSPESLLSRKGIAIAGIKKQDLGWLNKSGLAQEWEVFNYVADDTYATYRVPRNYGNEVMAFLTYIIDHYDKLPDVTVFIHGHDRAWHQPEPSAMLLNALDIELVLQRGWVPLRCTIWGRCENVGPGMNNPHNGNWGPHLLLQGLHGYAYRPEDPWYEPLPTQLAAACCAQFAASKRQIQSRPRKFWERLREPLLRDMEVDFKSWAPEEDDFSRHMGAAFEVSWHWHFGMPPVLCLEEDFCRKRIFRDKVSCDGDTTDWPQGHEGYKNITCSYAGR